MKKNGKTSAGTQRWRCIKCSASSVRKIDNRAKRLHEFLDWLLSNRTIKDLPYSRTTFWRRTAEFWRIWPIAPYTGEVHDVVFLDGIWIARDMVVLIACTKKNVLAWHLARSESAEAWAALMLHVPAPVMAVSDGSKGFAKAARIIWPTTRIQRCTFHIFEQVKRYTTRRPDLACGKELYAIAKELLKVKDADGASMWLAKYSEWCTRWHRFLGEYTFKDGKRLYTHERLRAARRSLSSVVNDKTLFTFIDLTQKRGGRWDSTNNMIEGGINAQLRKVIRIHSGMPALRRVKAVFWWCYMHAECPLPPAEILRVMPTDDEVDGLFDSASSLERKEEGVPEEYGKRINWNEFHMPTEFRR